MAIQLTVTGQPFDGFTAVELERGEELIGRVFELVTGWNVELRELERLLEPEVIQAVLAAKQRLLVYVNRTGAGMPDGLSVAGASAWLMQRSDGKGLSAGRLATE